jgi:hypothetical protein
MRYPYVVILKKNSERATDALSILLCFFSAISFLLSALHTIHSNSAMLSGALALLLLVGIIVNLVLRRKGKSAVRYRYWLLLAAIGWIGTTTTPWIGVFFFLLAFLEYQTKRPLEIGFDHDRIVMNTLIKRSFHWSMLNNVILKDGLLTLDFKDHRLIQREVADDEDEDDADEEEFNAWCRGQLGRS